MKNNTAPGWYFLTGAVVLLLAVMMGGCKPGTTTSGDTLKIIASITPVADFVEQIGGDKVEVTLMVPAGADPHTYEPTPGQMVFVSEADVFVKVGSGVDYEEIWMNDIMDMNRDMQLIDCSEGIDIINEDPHIWTSPLNARQMVENIYNGLITLDSDNADYYQTNYENYVSELETLHSDILNILEGYENRNFLIYHPSFAYFASEYNLIQIPIEHQGKEPTPKVIQDCIDQAYEHNLNYVYVAPQFATSYAESIAAEISGSVLYIDPLPSSYISGTRSVAASIALELE
ncbi:MAG TPA: zinc ABC transporter substrate-binding protein, partial [Dehalococcoidia bacterium]|nr:zinc ABC transporter substrate-binding protein [Dehalococcoidia bacterium]